MYIYIISYNFPIIVKCVKKFLSLGICHYWLYVLLSFKLPELKCCFVLLCCSDSYLSCESESADRKCRGNAV